MSVSPENIIILTIAKISQILRKSYLFDDFLVLRLAPFSFWPLSDLSFLYCHTVKQTLTGWFLKLSSDTVMFLSFEVIKFNYK